MKRVLFQCVALFENACPPDGCSRCSASHRIFPYANFHDVQRLALHRHSVRRSSWLLGVQLGKVQRE